MLEVAGFVVGDVGRGVLVAGTRDEAGDVDDEGT